MKKFMCAILLVVLSCSVAFAGNLSVGPIRHGMTLKELKTICVNIKETADKEYVIQLKPIAKSLFESPADLNEVVELDKNDRVISLVQVYGPYDNYGDINFTFGALGVETTLSRGEPESIDITKIPAYMVQTNRNPASDFIEGRVTFEALWLNDDETELILLEARESRGQIIIQKITIWGDAVKELI